MCRIVLTRVHKGVGCEQRLDTLFEFRDLNRTTYSVELLQGEKLFKLAILADQAIVPVQAFAYQSEAV